MASGDTLFVFTAGMGIPPTSSAAATPDRRGYDGHVIFDFDATTQEYLDFEGLMPQAYDGGGVTINYYYMMSSATTGGVVMSAAFERKGTADDLDSTQFAAANSASSTVPGTSGYTGSGTITFTDGADMDSVAAGDPFRLRASRVTGDGSDTASGDLEFVVFHAKET